jgi:hypothetical protein
MDHKQFSSKGGSSKSDRKREASRANMAKARAGRWPKSRVSVANAFGETSTHNAPIATLKNLETKGKESSRNNTAKAILKD